MRTRSLAPLLALTTALTVPLTGTAYAAGCSGFAVPPHLNVERTGIEGSGSMHCESAATNMTVTVCVEELAGGLLAVNAEWWSLGCTTTSTVEATTDVQGTVVVQMPVYSTYLRTTVTGTNDNGDTVATKSVPVWWFNCACYVG